MELWLVDIQPNLVDAWENEFNEFPEVQIVADDILKIAENTIISPANSYGFMDGGIDLHYTNYFGVKPQEEIQKLIKLNYLQRNTKATVCTMTILLTHHPKNIE